MSGHILYIGDAFSALCERPSASVQLVVTSPPYWRIKDYDHPDQIGLQDAYESYLGRLDSVWRECVRVLDPGCRLSINVGDQFLRASENGGVYAVAPIHADVIRQVLSIGGLTYLGGIIWRKITTTRTTGGGAWMGSIYYPRDGYVTYEHEFILLFKKKGKARKPSAEAKAKSRLTKQQRSEWFRGIWDISPARPTVVGHPAPFPVELPERLTRMFTFYGETVLDPFVGSGTTIEAADCCGRVGIGVDLNPAYADLARDRVPGLHVEVV